MDVKRIRWFLLFFTLFSVFIIVNYSGGLWKKLFRKDSWQEIQQERKQRVLDTCSKYPELQRQNLDYTHFYFSPDYALLYCAMGKVGSTTTFLTTFRQILVGEEWTEYAKG